MCDDIDYVWVSTCCGVEGFEEMDYGICPECKEHCDYEEVEADE